MVLWLARDSRNLLHPRLAGSIPAGRLLPSTDGVGEASQGEGTVRLASFTCLTQRVNFGL